MAGRCTDDVPPAGFEVPEGWEFVSEIKKNGSRVKYYTNVLGQKFYSEADLMRNINDAKQRGLSIYAPDFQAPTSITFGAKRQSHVQATSPSNKKHALRSDGRRGGLTSTCKEGTKLKKQKEIENCSDIECASTLLDLLLTHNTQNEVLGGASGVRNFSSAYRKHGMPNIKNACGPQTGATDRFRLQQRHHQGQSY